MIFFLINIEKVSLKELLRRCLNYSIELEVSRQQYSV